jgi:response regulator NasT
MTFLVKPVSEADVEAAVHVAMYRFKQYQAVRQETRDLKHTQEDRKVIERAKGVLRRRLALDEQEAFRTLRQVADNRNRKLAEVAQEILAADQVFQRMEDEACSGRTGI